MKLLRIKNTKQFALYCLFTILFVASYTVNFGYVAGKYFFHDFERRPEGLVLGRLSRAANDGVFSQGGLNGLNFVSTSIRKDGETLDNMEGVNVESYNRNLALQHDLYLMNKPLPDQFVAYKSQSGGQGICLSILQKFSPFSRLANLQIFRAMNALLFALVLVFFIAWVSRNFGRISGIVTFLLLFFSEMLTLYGHSLWWVVWNFYLPFMTMLLVLEKRNIMPNKFSDSKICLLVFVAVFLKCFFSGFEFITTTLVSAICPIVYYYIIENRKLWDFIRFSLKISVTMILAILSEMVILVLQIASYTGSVNAGVMHIIGSYFRRTDVTGENLSANYGEILIMYLKGNAFPFGFAPDKTQVYFGTIVLIFFVMGGFIIFFNRKFKSIRSRKYMGVVAMTFFSILAPLSWFIVFKEHSYNHPHIDFFVWYLPTFPLIFAVVGLSISACLPKCKSFKFYRINEH